MNKLLRSLFLIMILATISSAQKKEVVAYFPEWGVNYKPYYVKNIETSGAAEIITVINYAFSEPRPDSLGKIVPVFAYPDYAYTQVYSSDISIDGKADDPSQPLKGHFNQLKKLKQRHPHIRIVVSLGGWSGSVYFSDAALTPESRESFVNDCIDIFIKGNLPLRNGAGGKGVAAGIFDGIDIDWEFPISGGPDGIRHNPNDNDNLTELFKLFRKKLDEIDPKLLLTAALPSPKQTVANFNVSEDMKYLDWFCLMTYDFYGGWSPTTGHHTNLLTSEGENELNENKISLDKTVKLFMNRYGVPAKKLVPGLAFYGRGWKNVETINNGLFQSGSAAPGKYEEGHNYYSDVINLTGQGYEMFWDESALASWLYNPKEKIFWTFDDVKSVALKTRYSDAYNLKGVMFWDLSGDDDKGTLIKTIGSKNMPDVVVDNSRNEKSLNTISILQPINNNYFFEGANIIINTEVKEVKDEVVKVEFFINEKSIGYDTALPFSWAWFNAKEGNHYIKVAATDKTGAASVSELVKINVISKNSTFTLWQANKKYSEGEPVIFKGKIYVCIKNHDNSLEVNSPQAGTGHWQLLNGVE